MKPVDEIKERNRSLGIVAIDDVDELYNQLPDWDKEEFIEKHIYDSGYADNKQEEEDDIYHFNDIWEFVRDHDDDELLDEIGEGSCFRYLADQWTLKEFIDELKDRGKTWSTGYTDKEFIYNLDLTTLDKEAQEKILKQLDKSIIENFLLKNNTENNG